MKKYAGIHVPLVTPFRDGNIDFQALDTLVEYYCNSDAVSLIPCGTTGESCTLTHDEQKEIISHVVRKVAKRKLVIAGTGSNNTLEAIELTRYAYEAGADACLVVSPYYNRPTQEGIVLYFETLAREVPVDIILYDIPGRTGSLMSLDTIVRLAGNPGIKGIKEGYGDITRFQELTGRLRHTDFAILTGEDTLLFECVVLGGDGGVMAAAGLIPNELAKVHRLLVAGALAESRELHHQLLPHIRNLFAETNPIVVKYALSQVLGIPYELRSPLTKATHESCVLIDGSLEALAAIKVK